MAKKVSIELVNHLKGQTKNKTACGLKITNRITVNTFDQWCENIDHNANMCGKCQDFDKDN